MAKKLSGPQMLVANRLDDGRAVFFTGTGWSSDAAEAAAAEGDALDALAERAGRDEAANIVTGIERIEAEITESGVRPAHIKHQMQATGPSVRRDLGYQSSPKWEQ